jgi:hypothetical protein
MTFTQRNPRHAKVRCGYCSGCPFDFGKEETEMAYNLGCLPGISKIDALCEQSDTAWACHSEPNKVCLGHARRRNKELQHLEGVHSPYGVPPRLKYTF